VLHGYNNIVTYRAYTSQYLIEPMEAYTTYCIGLCTVNFSRRWPEKKTI